MGLIQFVNGDRLLVKGGTVTEVKQGAAGDYLSENMMQHYKILPQDVVMRISYEIEVQRTYKDGHSEQEFFEICVVVSEVNGSRQLIMKHEEFMQITHDQGLYEGLTAEQADEIMDVLGEAVINRPETYEEYLKQ